MKTCPRCSKTYGDELQVCPDDQSTLVVAGSGKSDPMVGRLLAGRFQLEKKIGEGGMGAIYKAVHTGMGRICAIKLLTLLSPGDDAVARFKREAKMASRIDNPHAVTIYDFGQSEDGTLFLAMEFIDGVPLSRLLSQERALPATRAIHIASQIAEGLAAAHALEIIHRDLKPDNIMLTRKGAALDYVKVLDFGIAKTVADDSADNLTKTGFVLGTPVYMSPEQLLGEKLDPRSDIYSLAIIVYEMLSGRLPFEGENQQSIMMKRITSEPVRITRVAPSISEALERAVMGGLARDPAVRTRTVEAFAASLRTALQSGTQFFGGRATARLTDDQAGLATQQYSGFETSADAPAAMAGPPVTRSAAGDSPAVFAQHSASGVPPHTADQIAAMSAQPTELSIRQPQAVSPAAASAASASIASEPRRRSPLLLWGGALVLIAIALVVYLLLPFGGSGFTVTVRGAPAGSEVFVNDVSRGQTAADGTLKVAGLTADAVTVRVSHDGFADFNANIDRAKGREQSLEALLLPVEIDYKGKMALIPAGEFLMGSDRPGPNEQTARKVTLPDYYIDKYEVTNAQYKQFCDATGHSHPKTSFIYGEFARKPLPDEDYFLKHPDSPVIGVTYEDAIAYANWINKRIPGEDEWEKAASWDPNTGKKRLWPWGNETAGTNANIDRKKTAILAPGGQFDGDKSAYGVFDLGGNISEYVSIKSDSSGNENPSASLGAKYIVVRGGSFMSDFENAKSTKRGVISLEANKTIDGDPLFGFRCAMYANDPKIQEVLRSRRK